MPGVNVAVDGVVVDELIFSAKVCTPLRDITPPMPPTMSSTISLSIFRYPWSMGAMLLMGCVTKVTLYSIKNTMPAKMTVTIRTTKAHTLTSISSCVRSRLTWNLGWLLDNLFLQYRCY